MPAPVMYFQHALDYLKGWPNPAAVDFVAKKSANVTVAQVYGGRVVHLNNSNEFELGAVGTQMPIFCIQGSDSFDVANLSTTANGHQWYGIAPAGHMSGLVAVGSYELETTEYDQTATYHPNDLLHSPTELQDTATDNAGAGLLYNHRNWGGGNAGIIVQFVDHVCGVVSRGARVNSMRQNVLSFWPYFLPGQDATH